MNISDDFEGPGDPGPEPDSPGDEAVLRHDASLAAFERFVEQALVRSSKPPALDHIDKFEVLEELGRGTFGQVYLAHDPDLDCLRAIKIPTNLVLDNPRLRNQFLREARDLQKIDNHQNVVRVVHAGEEIRQGRPYFVMEYCPGGSLSAWLRKRPKELELDERWIANLMVQIVDGVDWIHHQKLCHRDLKPGNILLVEVGEGSDPQTPTFCPKVTDFGLAIALDDPDATATYLSGPVGTIAYIPPEQVHGKRSEIGRASDVYGLGSILFELVARRKAYNQGTTEEILKALLSDSPSPSLREANGRASRDMQTIVHTAMAKHPADRYASAAEMADDLRRLSRGEPVKGAPWWRKARSWTRIHRAPLAVAAALLVVVGMGSLAYSYARQKDLSVWIQKLGVPSVQNLADVVDDYSPHDRRVRSQVEALLDASPPVRLNASVFLASVRDDCADRAFEALLSAPVGDIGPLALALVKSRPDIAQRLEKTAAKITRTRNPSESEAETETETERFDRRRATAAAALILIGRSSPGLGVLTFTPEPQARSFLVHLLAPVGVPPEQLLNVVKTTEVDCIRRSCLQAMGEYSNDVWDKHPAIKQAIIKEALRLYRDDEDAGVHGSAKWLLRLWDLDPKMKAIDEDLKGKIRTGFDWRITKTGLTMVVVNHPDLKHPIEVSDCEITLSQYTVEFPEHVQYKPYGISPDSPVNDVDASRAGAFCNRISGKEQIKDEDFAYESKVNGTEHVYYLKNRVLKGFRLPTDREFEVLQRAGVGLRIYYGTSTDLARHYAQLAQDRPTSVARYKPNDSGLFDTLGNLSEWTHPIEGFNGPKNQARLCGASFTSTPFWPEGQMKQLMSSINRMDDGLRLAGFRVVRDLIP